MKGRTCQHVVNHGENVLDSVVLAQALQQVHEELRVGLSVLWEKKRKKEGKKAIT